MKRTDFYAGAKVVLFSGMLIATVCFDASLGISKPRVEVSLPNPSSSSNWNSFNPINAGTATLNLIVPLPNTDFKTEYEIKNQIEQGQTKIWMNGKMVEFKRGGGGEVQAGAMREHSFGFNVYPGAPGPKKVKIQIGKWKAENSFDYRPEPAIFILGPPDEQEGLFVPKVDPIHWDGYYLDPQSVRVLVNSLPVKPQFSSEEPDGFHLSGTIETALSPGTNTVEVDAVDGSGNTRTARTEFYFYPKNKIAVNDVFFLRESRSGSNMGPFYNVTIQGKSVVETSAEKYTGSSVRISRGYYFDRLKAVKPGKSNVEVWETNMRNENQHKVFEIQVEVIGK
jgi:hypothetical protein